MAIIRTRLVERKSRLPNRRSLQQWLAGPQLHRRPGPPAGRPRARCSRGSGAAPAPVGPLADPEHDQGEADAGQQEPGEVEAAGMGLAVLVEEEQAEDEGDDPDGQVDEEDPPPREVGHQQPAEDRSEGRGHRGGDGQDARGPHPLLGGEGAEQHGHAHRGHHAAADPWMTRKKTSSGRLSARPQRTEAPVNMAMAKSRTRLDPEPVAQPAGGGDEHGQADQVPDRHRVERPSPTRGTGGRWTGGPR